MGTSGDTHRRLLQCGFQHAKTGLKKIEKIAIGLADGNKNGRIQQGTEHQRWSSFLFRSGIDTINDVLNLGRTIQKSSIVFFPFDAIELGQQAMP